MILQHGGPKIRQGLVQLVTRLPMLQEWPQPDPTKIEVLAMPLDHRPMLVVQDWTGSYLSDYITLN
jgi:hypothetical protein